MVVSTKKTKLRHPIVSDEDEEENKIIELNSILEDKLKIDKAKKTTSKVKDISINSVDSVSATVISDEESVIKQSKSKNKKIVMSDYDDAEVSAKKSPENSIILDSQPSQKSFSNYRYQINFLTLNNWII